MEHSFSVFIFCAFVVRFLLISAHVERPTIVQYIQISRLLTHSTLVRNVLKRMRAEDL